MDFHIYDKDSLQITMLCGLLLSGVDQHFEEDETEVCFRYLDDHWDPHFGRQGRFLEQVEQQRRRIIRDPAEYFAKMDRLGVYINESFTGEQKSAFLIFLDEVMNADGLIDPHEKDFVQIFNKRISKL